MKKNEILNIAKLRFAVGFLGEAHQKKWWVRSNFFSSHSMSFLNPVFTKTSFLAQYYGVKEAATRVHDDHIGIGKGVYHLFRLPEMIEIDLHEFIAKQTEGDNFELITSNHEAAEALLSESAKHFELSDTGPVWMGDASLMSNPSSWQKVAHLYLSAFYEDKRIYPYFSGMK